MGTLNTAGLYSAFKAGDARFDGRYFVGISSTGVYCRPVCKAKRAKEEHCSFYATSAEAEKDGYRPCLLCRPERAPGLSVADASTVLAHKAARLLEENCGSHQSLEVLSGKLGCTSRHLRRVFADEYQVSPVQYLQTCRLHLAKNLLTDTKLSILDVAMTAGFGSLRRFNDVFRKRYRLSPTALRKHLSANQATHECIDLSLGYRPPYRWEEMLRFLETRATPGVELVRDGAYYRTVQLETTGASTRRGWFKVSHIPEKNALQLVMSETLLPVLPLLLARVKQLFDLNCSPSTIFETLESMNSLQADLCMPGVRIPGSFDSFEMAIRAVLEQQVSPSTANSLAAKLVSAYGEPLETGIEGLTHTFPSRNVILSISGNAEERLAGLGIRRSRARAILEIAMAEEQGKVDLRFCTQPEEEVCKLLKIPGIGAWTAQYLAIRSMEWPDVFLAMDASVRKALAPRTAKELKELSEIWRPWRSYATVNLWYSLYPGRARSDT